MGGSISKLPKGYCRIYVEKALIISRRELLRNRDNQEAEAIYSYCLHVLKKEYADFPSELSSALRKLGIVTPIKPKNTPVDKTPKNHEDDDGPLIA